MSILAIKGDLNHGDKVIEIFEMLGGYNKWKTSAFKNYYIILNNKNNAIEKLKDIKCYNDYQNYSFYTLDSFNKEFPYQLNDKILINTTNEISTITKMRWNGEEVIYSCLINNEEKDYKSNELSKINNTEKKTNIDNSIYPKSFEDCYKILYNKDYTDDTLIINNLPHKDTTLFINLFKLKICRDAYWELCDCDENTDCRYIIHLNDYSGNIIPIDEWTKTYFLRFPVRDARIAFMENFENLIKDTKFICKKTL